MASGLRNLTMKYLLATAAVLALTNAAAAGAEVPAKYRGLWCDTEKGPVYWYRCRKATSEAYQDIGRDRMKVDEENSCRIAAVRPIAKGHRLTLDCAPNVREPPKYID